MKVMLKELTPFLQFIELNYPKLLRANLFFIETKANIDAQFY